MRLPFGIARGKKPDKRTDFDKLINEPVDLWVGGRLHSKPKRITLREPSLLELGKHVGLIVGALVEAAQKNATIFEKLQRKLKLDKGDTVDFADVPEAAVALLCDLVDEDEDYVLTEITGKQMTAVIATYLDLVGWDFISETFSQARQSWNTAMDAAIGKPSRPPWSARASSSSAAN